MKRIIGIIVVSMLSILATSLNADEAFDRLVEAKRIQYLNYYQQQVEQANDLKSKYGDNLENMTEETNQNPNQEKVIEKQKKNKK